MEMKKILLKSVEIFHPQSIHHNHTRNILIENGMISQISSDDITEEEDVEIIHNEGAILSPGWFDLRVNFCDPGFEYRETIKTGSEAAAYGGMTGVGLTPATQPNINTKAHVEYVINEAKKHIVEIAPLAGLMKEGNDAELSEMYELNSAGAKAYSTGNKTLADSGLLLRAMMYGKSLNKPLMILPLNAKLANDGQMNEGLINIQLGLKGSPALAEETEVMNGIALAKYANAHLHFGGISTAKSFELIEKAVNEGLPVTADVSIHHLQFIDEDLLDFNTQLKFKVPLRNAMDRVALQQGLLKHDWLTVTSNHEPREEDRKKCEFELAAYGAIGAQTLFSQLIQIYPEGQWKKALEALIYKSRKILSLDIPDIKVGEEANFTLFNPSLKWRFDESTNKSKSKNSPLWKEELTGKAILLFNKSKMKYLS